MEAFQLGVPESQLIKIIAQNLKNPTAKLLILDQNCKNLKEVLHVARNCEASRDTDRPSKEQMAIGELKNMILELIKNVGASKYATITPVQPEVEDRLDSYEQQWSQNYVDEPQRFLNNKNHNAQVFQNRSYQNRPTSASFQTQKPTYQRQRVDTNQTRVNYENQYTRTPRLCIRYCGTTHVLGRDNCPAKDKSCTFCHKPEHFQSVCRNKRTTQSANTQ